MKISIIIPVYNVEKYITNCLSNILNQTYKKIEIIVVDDGSTDESVILCDKFEKEYQNIKVVHQENKGLSGARNTGLKYVTGEYFFFLDADDWIDKDYVKQCVSFLNKDKPDILVTSFKKEYKDKTVGVNLNVKPKKRINIKNGRSFFLRRLIGEYGKELKHPGKIEDYNPVWGKFYKTKVFRQQKFPDNRKYRSEDLLFNIDAFYKAKSYEYLNTVYYHYNKQNEGSIVSSHDPVLFKQFNKLYGWIDHFITEKDLPKLYKKSLNNRIILNLITISINECMLTPDKFKDNKEKFINILNDDLYKKAFSKFSYTELPLSYKMFFKLCEYKRVYLLRTMVKIAMSRREEIKR